MKYKELGKSDLKVSEIGFGCMSLGDHQNENERLLRQAYEQGINLFDTADLYQQGENELSLGRALQGIREKVIVATKVGNQWRPDGSGWDWNPSKKYILEAVEKSLQRLQTDYIDLYQLHGGTIDDSIDETIEAFEKLMEQGKIRYYGISSIRPNVIREYVNRSGIVSVMMQYSLLDRRPEESMLELLQENSIGVLARGSLAKGLLVNKEPTPYLNFGEEEVKKAANTIHSVAGDERKPSEVAIRFVADHPAISSAVIGIRTQQQLQEALEAGEGNPLSQEEMEALRNSIPANKYEQHR